MSTALRAAALAFAPIRYFSWHVRNESVFADCLAELPQGGRVLARNPVRCHVTVSTGALADYSQLNRVVLGRPPRSGFPMSTRHNLVF